MIAVKVKEVNRMNLNKNKGRLECHYWELRCSIDDLEVKLQSRVLRTTRWRLFMSLKRSKTKLFRTKILFFPRKIKTNKQSTHLRMQSTSRTSYCNISAKLRLKKLKIYWRMPQLLRNSQNLQITGCISLACSKRILVNLLKQKCVLLWRLQSVQGTLNL